MSLDNRDGVIWFDGKMCPWRDAKVHVLTHALHYGTSVFEGVRAYPTNKGPMIFRLHEHTKRLFASARILGMDIPFSQQRINQAHCEVVSANGLDAAYIRPLFFYGSEKLGLHARENPVHAIIAAWQWGSYLGEENIVRGIRLRTTSFTRNHVNAAMSRAKIGGNYVNSVLAINEIHADGYDEALFLDAEGYVSEGAGENLFVVYGDELHTPSLGSVLGGITRNTVICLAREAGIPVVERRLTRDDVYVADEAFFTGTAAEVTPIREVDRKPIGAGQRGPITEKLQQQYFDLVHGRLTEHRQWLFPLSSPGQAVA